MDTYQTQAHTVTAQRRKAGRYPTKAQIKAGRKLIGQGVAALSREELTLLSTHPDMGSQQKAEWKAMAASVNWAIR